MTELTLFIDPYETDFPGPVCELLKQASAQYPVYATVTQENYCVFICGNVMYLFFNKIVNFVRTVKLSLPSTGGLQYSTNAVCIFRNKALKSPHPSVVVVSPEGIVRYWSDVSKPFYDLNLNLNNEVAFSICLIESYEHVHRFLVSTTTASTFHLVEIFHNTTNSDNLTNRLLEISSSEGIGRRMSKLLFGSFAAQSELVVKTLFVGGGSIRSSTVDVIAVLPRVLRFFSIQTQQFVYEYNVAEALVAHIRENVNKSSDTYVIQSQVCIVDANVYQRGLLMLIAVVTELSNDPHFIKADFYLGYLKEKHSDSGKYVSSFVPILLPSSMSQMDQTKLSKCKLLVANDEECAIILSRSMIVVLHPTTDHVDAVILDDIDDYVLGAATVDGLCHVILREHGVCVLRRLPRQFDLSFWRKYGDRLEEMDEDTFGDQNLLKKSFIAFCSKDLKKTKKLADKLVKKTGNLAELVVELDKYFVDYRPKDLRWTSDDNLIPEDQIPYLQEQMKEDKNLPAIAEQLGDKLSHHNMFLLFLEQYNLLNSIDRSISSHGGRNGTELLAEFGEKLITSALCVSWLLNQWKERAKLPELMSKSINTLRREFLRRFQHSNCKYLTPLDYVFCEVSNFGDLISMVVTEGDDSLKQANMHQRLAIVLEVGDVLGMVANGVEKARKDEQTLNVRADSVSSSWLQQLLIYFIRHFNVAMDLLEALTEADRSQQSAVFSNCLRVARFVLSQQGKCQRDNSQIIARFLAIDATNVALDLAEKFHDFTTLIEYCHQSLNEPECRATLNHYKQMFANEDFDLLLYEYYRKKGMVNHLLAEKGNRLTEYLASHDNINWIRNIDNGEYAQACKTLKKMAIETENYDKKLVELSLCKLCLLCQPEEERDMGQLAEISDAIRLIIEESENNAMRPKNAAAASFDGILAGAAQVLNH